MFKIVSLLVIAIYSYGLNLPKIKDVSSIPQDFGQFAKDLNTTFSRYHAEFNQRYFKPWEDDLQASQNHLLYGIKYVENKQYFGDNRQEISEAQKNKIIENANIQTFPTLKLNAVTIRNTDCRLLPTNKPFFYDFKKQGGGYPFDYLQNSMIHINTPIKVLHYSLDKAFVFVEAPYVNGWVSSSDIAFVSQDDINKTKLMKLVTPNIDELSLNDKNNFISKAFIGSILNQDSDDFIYVFKSDSNSNGVLTKIQNHSSEFIKIPQIPTKANLEHIAVKLYGQNYGWGGFLQNRDCSMMLRDFYTPFGLFLPRNSIDQINDKAEEIINLEGKTNEEKIKLIKEKGVPFATFLYKKGHIMMYIGTVGDEVVIYHSFWSIKTINKGRFIVGGTFVTSLAPGIELEEYDHTNGTLLDKLTAIRVLQ